LEAWRNSEKGRRLADGKTQYGWKKLTGGKNLKNCLEGPVVLKKRRYASLGHKKKRESRFRLKGGEVKGAERKRGHYQKEKSNSIGPNLTIKHRQQGGERKEHGLSKVSKFWKKSVSTDGGKRGKKLPGNRSKQEKGLCSHILGKFGEREILGEKGSWRRVS